MKKKLILFIEVLTLIAVSIAVVVYFSTKDNGESKQPENVPMYTVSFDTNGAETQIQSVQVKQGEKVYKPVDPIYTGHYLDNWKLNDTPWLFDYYTVYSNMTLKASWQYIEYQITLKFNEEGKEDQIIKYNVDDSFELDRPEQQGNIFVGWFDNNNNRIDSINQGTTGNMVLSARWVDNLVIKSLDESRGNIAVYADKDDPTKFTVKNVPADNKYHVFKGWIINGVTHYEETYTFNTSLEETTYIESFYMDDNEEEEWNLAHGVTPKLIDDKYVAYGMYPQDNINNEDLIARLEKSEITKLNNYYYDYPTNSYYAKQTTHIGKDLDTEEQLNPHKYDNDVEMIEGKECWFRVKPIEWKIISKSDNTFTLLANKLIDVKKYSNVNDIRIIDGKVIYANNYQYSYIRNWLNTEFVNSSFKLNDSHIIETLVDNSKETMEIPYQEYECNNTVDKVFLLSYQDYLKSEYGFNNITDNNKIREFKTTDYSRAKGAVYGTSEYNLYSGYFWTRSPKYIDNDEHGGQQSRVNKNGGLNNADGNSNYSCFQPSINIVFDL